MKKRNLFIFTMAMMAIVAFTPAVRADTFTLGLGFGFTSNGYVVGPVTNSTLNGKPLGGVICDDSQHRSGLGTTWAVTSPRPSPSGSVPND